MMVMEILMNKQYAVLKPYLSSSLSGLFNNYIMADVTRIFVCHNVIVENA
jgi:hypothetical protein